MVERTLTEETLEANCGNCRFCKMRRNPDGSLFYICARRSPKVTHALVPEQTPHGITVAWKTCSSWPETGLDKWCGEHERTKH